MRKEGLFLSFEGGEGCGKSTQIRLLVEYLRGLGREVLLTREPGGTAAGEEIRHILQHSDGARNLVPEAELLLFAASRSQLVREVIEPALAAGKVVLSDRFFDSTTVYQGVARKLDPALVERINQFAVGSCRPQMTIYLRVSSEVSRARMEQRSAREPGRLRDRLEEQPVEFHEAVDAGYRELARRHPERVVTVDGEGAPEEVFAEILKILQERCHGLFLH
jgi:dTMP kinase